MRVVPSDVVDGPCEANREACYWRGYCQGESLGRGRATTVESPHRHFVNARWMCVRHPHPAGRRITCERSLEVGRGGNIDARGVGRRGIRRNRRIGAQRK